MISLGIFGDESTEHFAAGKVIFREGDPAGRMYVVAEGEISIIVGSQVVEVAGPGSIFGEMALIDGSPRSATVTAKTSCELAAIDERRFEVLVKQNPYFAVEVMRVMADRLRNTDRLLVSQQVSR